MIQDLLLGNSIYNEHVNRWQFLYNSYVGGDDYRKGGYLTRYQLETDAEYAARCQATPLDNQCKSVVSTYNSFLYRHAPIRDLPDDWFMQDFLQDADLEGRSFDNFMQQVNIWSLVFGHCWVLVTKPNINASSLAEEQANQIRPYVSLLTPLTVLDWKFERKICGRYELKYIRYVEDINGSVHTIKEWHPDQIITTTIDTNKGEQYDQVIEDNQLGIIPAVIAYADRSIIRGLGVSAISDVSDMQRYIYNALSEADQSIRLDSHPSLVATPDTEIGTGAGSVIQIPESIDPGLVPYILDFNGASIDSIYTVIKNSIETIEKITNIGGIRATGTRQISGVALETEFQLLNARLSSLANNLELTEEQIFKIYALYQNQYYDFTIEYPDSFEIRDIDNQLSQLQQAQNIAQDPNTKQQIEQRLIELLDLEPMTETDTQEPNNIENQ